MNIITLIAKIRNIYVLLYNIRSMVIYWHKRDMRLIDNQALDTAINFSIENKLTFLPIMGLEKNLIENIETAYEFSKFAQFGYLSAMLPLYQNYKYHKVDPILFYDDILNVLDKINNIESITYLISHMEHGTDGTYTRDNLVQEFCKNNNIKWEQIQPSGVIRNIKSRDTRSKVVKEYLSNSIIPVPDFSNILQNKIYNNFDSKKNFIELDNFKKITKGNHDLAECSEKHGLTSLETFVTSRADGYRGGISSPNSAIMHGSRLSQYLAFGSLSIRYIDQYFSKNIKSTDSTKIKSGILGATQRLHWREHFIQRLETDPSMPCNSINPDFNNIDYAHNLNLFEKYKLGMTGEVLIDACMRCLLQTGFINFRMRALLVSYGVFGLDLNWRDLGRYLAELFLDYEPGIHWSQIQMQAGITGINTIRVYSPHKQLLDQDPECIFVRKWIPELNNLTNEEILDYPNTSLSILTNNNYPDPIVNFKNECKINKAKTYLIKKISTKETSKKVFEIHGSRKKKIITKKSQKPVIKETELIPSLFN